MIPIVGFLKQARRVAYGASALVLVLLVTNAAAATEPEVNTTAGDVAINGYDTVAYFTDGKATKGSQEHEAVWQNAHWRFASPEHRRLFEADPSRYAPQFGGWCAAGVAEGEYFQVDAEAWTIVDGKLYLNYSRKVRDKWQENRSELIAKADRVWAERAKTN